MLRALSNLGGGSGGSTVPAGSNGQIQFNNSGAFGADSGLVRDSLTGGLNLNTGPLYIANQASPATPTGGGLDFVGNGTGNLTGNRYYLSPSGALTNISSLHPLGNSATGQSAGYGSQQWYDNAITPVANSTIATSGTAAVYIYPFMVGSQVTIDTFGVYVSTAGVTGATLKVGCYQGDAGATVTGFSAPGALLWESATLTADTVGGKSESRSYTFLPGIVYWFTVRTSVACTLRSLNTASARGYGKLNSSAAGYFTGLTRNYTYTTNLPSTWVYSAAENLSNVTPIMFNYKVA